MESLRRCRGEQKGVEFRTPLEVSLPSRLLWSLQKENQVQIMDLFSSFFRSHQGFLRLSDFWHKGYFILSLPPETLAKQNQRIAESRERSAASGGRGVSNQTARWFWCRTDFLFLFFSVERGESRFDQGKNRTNQQNILGPEDSVGDFFFLNGRQGMKFSDTTDCFSTFFVILISSKRLSKFPKVFMKRQETKDYDLLRWICVQFCEFS